MGSEIITILILELTWILKISEDLVTTKLLGKTHYHSDYYMQKATALN